MMIDFFIPGLGAPRKRRLYTNLIGFICLGTWYKDTQQQLKQFVSILMSIKPAKAEAMNKYMKEMNDCSFKVSRQTADKKKGHKAGHTFKALLAYSDNCDFTSFSLACNGSIIIHQNDEYQLFQAPLKFFNLHEKKEQTGRDFLETLEVLHQHNMTADVSSVVAL